ncbi:MAG TPA: NUDIX domain-containing protein [Nitrososphaerales archaeon]|nr:NUDIX domain-containing protein [Nitrososphaerales archaeon]
MIEERSAGAVIFYSDKSATNSGNSRLFLVLHYPAGHWDFPKGALEKGETEEQAARREIMEETGLRINSFLPNFRKLIDYHYRRSEGLSHKQVVFFLARSEKKDVTISFEHSGYDWLTLEQALRRLTFENARNILREANAFLSKVAVSDKPL